MFPRQAQLLLPHSKNWRCHVVEISSGLVAMLGEPPSEQYGNHNQMVIVFWVNHQFTNPNIDSTKQLTDIWLRMFEHAYLAWQAVALFMWFIKLSVGKKVVLNDPYTWF